MKLYYYPISTYSQKVMLALHEKQVTFEPSWVQLFDPAVRAEYEKIYPLGKIPLLQTATGQLIPESTSIIEYLEATVTSGTRLIPQDPELAAETRLLDRLSDFYLNDPVVSILFEQWKPEASRDRKLIEKSRHTADLSYHRLDLLLSSRQWLMGEHFTLADCATIPCLFYARQIHPFEQHTHLTRYYEDACERDSYKQVLDEARPVLNELSQNRT